MTFVQIIECQTRRPDDMNRLMDTWVEQTQGKRTATHALVGIDRADTAHLVEIVEFPSYEDAMRNSGLPETDRIFHEMTALCEAPPTFTNLDITRDEHLNKTTARRLLEQLGAGNLDIIHELCAADYRDHEHADDTTGPQAFHAKATGYRTAFDDFTFTIEDQIAEDDRVATRWTWNATHTGEFMGLPATGQHVQATGTTVFRITDGKIQEGWWNWDTLGVMRQLGLTDT